MTLNFRYKKEPERSKEHLPKYSPIIPVTLKYKTKFLDVAAFVDSGSDTIVLPRSIAEILGIDLSGEKELVTSIGKDDIESITTKIEVTVQQKHESYKISAFVSVILNRDDFNVLLGRAGFFNNFEVTFKENDKKVILKKVFS